MSRNALRRASYGPASPVIGERGRRTRSRIIHVTLELIRDRGVKMTTVDEVARAAGISRATLYQYFGCKQEVLVELVETSGRALLDVLNLLGPLGPTREGLARLGRLFDDWATVYGIYATIFVQESSMDSPEAPLRPMVANWMSNYVGRMSKRMAAAGVDGAPGVELEDLALVLWSTFERYSFYLELGLGSSASQAPMTTMATAAQLLLFPATPSDVLAEFAPRSVPTGAVGPPPERPVPVSDRPSTRLGRVGPVARQTVQRLVEAGRQVFAAVGFDAASVEQIITRAGVGRGTFYKYFEGKQDLLLLLSAMCLADVATLFGQLEAVGRPGTVRAWVDDFVRLHLAQAGVLRAWSDVPSLDPRVLDDARRAVTIVTESSEALLGRIERSYPFDGRAASLLMMGFLERFPGTAAGTRYERPPDVLAAIMTEGLERAFLNPGTTRR